MMSMLESIKGRERRKEFVLFLLELLMKHLIGQDSLHSTLFFYWRGKTHSPLTMSLTPIRIVIIIAHITSLLITCFILIKAFTSPAARQPFQKWVQISINVSTTCFFLFYTFHTFSLDKSIQNASVFPVYLYWLSVHNLLEFYFVESGFFFRV